MNTESNSLHNIFDVRKSASLSLNPSQAPSSISTKIFSPEGKINQSQEDLAKEWEEFNAMFTLWDAPHKGHGREFIAPVILVNAS